LNLKKGVAKSLRECLNLEKNQIWKLLKSFWRKVTFYGTPLPASFDWNDLGTWGALYEKLDKDAVKNAVVNGLTHLEDASGNMIRTARKKIVVVDGLQDYIIVDKEDVLLIYPKDKQQDIKKVRSQVKENFGDKYV